jgi:hypothetical protein
MLFKEIVAVYTENHKRQINKKIRMKWFLKQVVRVVTTGL